MSETKPKAYDAWFHLADAVAREYGIPFAKIDDLAAFMQKTAFEISTRRDD